MKNVRVLNHHGHKFERISLKINQSVLTVIFEIYTMRNQVKLIFFYTYLWSDHYGIYTI